MPEAMIFDFDGTLADSSEGIFHTAFFSFRKLGVTREYTEEDLRRFVGPPLRQCFVVAFGLDEALLDDALDIYRKEYDEHGRFMMHLYPHMKDVLVKLKSDGVKLAVATFKSENLVKSCLEYLGVIDLFDSIHGSSLSEDLTKGDIIKLALSDLGTDSAETLMIGDTLSDLRGAEDAGTGFAAVTYGFGFKPGESLENYRTISEAGDLLQLF